jgi:hypothetical protein
MKIVRSLLAALVALTLAAPPVAAQSANTVYTTGPIAIILTGISVNSAATDVGFASIPYSKYIVRRVTLFDVSTSLGASAATLGVFTGTGGGGSAIVALATMTALTGSTKRVDSVVALTTDYVGPSQLVVRCGTAHGSAATLSILFEIQPLN